MNLFYSFHESFFIFNSKNPKIVVDEIFLLSSNLKFVPFCDLCPHIAPLDPALHVSELFLCFFKQFFIYNNNFVLL